jgi:hypothetical protein
MLRPVALTLTLALTLALAAPAAAQDSTPAPDRDTGEGLGLMERGTRLFLEGLMREFGSAVDGLEEALRDLSAYHPPEVLPNGDILIRRRTPLVPEAQGEDGPVDL